jgi:heterotetrameric sarcosine oxidase gamma subunit
MPDAQPRRRSALAALYREGSHGAETGVTLAERRPGEILQLSTWADAREIAGINLPAANRASTTGTITAIWIGPRRWLLVGEGAGRLLAGSSAVLVDQSHGRTLIRVAGPRRRDVLGKGTGIDLERFEQGAAAVTLLGHVSVVLHAVAEDAVDVYAPRSLALTLWEWLFEASSEYGCTVAPRF